MTKRVSKESLVLAGCVIGLILAGVLVFPRAVSHADATANLNKMPSKDIFVASGQPNQVQPNDRALWAGLGRASQGEERILLQFDLNEIPAGSQIDDAKLRLTLGGTNPGDPPLPIQVARITEDNWSETITWNQHLLLPVDETHAVVTQVGTALVQYEWDVRTMLQAWSNQHAGDALSLRLRANTSSGLHIRAFFSKDCSDADCGVPPGKRPQLVISYQTPTSTPTHTPTATATNTATSTSTPTPTPGLASLRLINEPTGVIAPGEWIEYTIEYRNGPYALTAFEIRNVIPTSVVLVGTPSFGGIVDGNTVRWPIGNLIANAAGSVYYRVARPTNTSTPTKTPTSTPTAPAAPNLSIQVSMTATPNPATIAQTIKYTITIRNTGNTEFETLELRDEYQSNCVTVTYAEQWPPDHNNPPNLIWNNIGNLAPGGEPKTFWITFLAKAPCSAPDNPNTITVKGKYQGSEVSDDDTVQVQIKRSDSAVGGDLLVSEELDDKLVEELVIFNSGAIATWMHNGQPYQMDSNAVANPPWLVYLPLMLHR